MRALAIFLISAAVATTANSHEWFDPECCSGDDCQEAVSVLEVEGGDLITTADGRSAVFPKSMTRRSSRDGHIYACIGPGNYPRCLYVPDRSV